MADPYLSLRAHLVWATKHRKPWLDPEWRPKLFAYTAGAVASKQGKLLAAGGSRDHIHLYLEFPSTVAVADLVSALKANMSRWIHDRFPHRRDFRWQHGYGAFSVTSADDGRLKAYIRNQDLHHRDQGFAGEYVTLLDQHGLTYDARYMLD